VEILAKKESLLRKKIIKPKLKMKKLLLSFAIAFVGCGSDKNQLMTNLVNEKKALEDSIVISHANEADFEQKAKESGDKDTTIQKSLLDSTAKYFGVNLRQKERLEAVNFSIDSLSKMK
jgi:hypothetical protein